MSKEQIQVICWTIRQKKCSELLKYESLVLRLGMIRKSQNHIGSQGIIRNISISRRDTKKCVSPKFCVYQFQSKQSEQRSTGYFLQSWTVVATGWEKSGSFNCENAYDNFEKTVFAFLTQI